VVNIPSFTRFYRSKWWFHGFSEPSTVQNAEPLISIARVLHLSKHTASRCAAATGGVATCHFLAGSNMVLSEFKQGCKTWPKSSGKKKTGKKYPQNPGLLEISQFGPPEAGSGIHLENDPYHK